MNPTEIIKSFLLNNTKTLIYFYSIWLFISQIIKFNDFGNQIPTYIQLYSADTLLLLLNLDQFTRLAKLKLYLTAAQILFYIVPKKDEKKKKKRITIEDIIKGIIPQIKNILTLNIIDIFYSFRVFDGANKILNQIGLEIDPNYKLKKPERADVSLYNIVLTGKFFLLAFITIQKFKLAYNNSSNIVNNDNNYSELLLLGIQIVITAQDQLDLL